MPLLRRLSRAAAAVTVTAVIAGILVGCTDQEVPATDDLAIVVAPVMGGVAVDPSELDRVLAALDAEGDRVVAVVADGDPEVVADYELPELPGNGLDRTAFLEDTRADVRTALLTAAASAPEIDLAEAIALVSHSFRDGRRHTLVVYASGISTAGAMSMLDGRLYAEPADLVANAATYGIPDLSTVSVQMPLLGDVTDPQAMNENARTQLASIWAAYFAQARAADVDLATTDLLATAPTADSLPTVTPVSIERPGPIDLGCRQLLGTSSIGFEAGEATFTDPAATTQLIEGVVERLASCPGSYRVEGSASSEGDANEALSTDRATNVAAVLSQVSGTLVSAMTIVGWGAAWPCRQDDVDDAGALIIDAAVSNRVVVVSKVQAGSDPGC